MFGDCAHAGVPAFRRWLRVSLYALTCACLVGSTSFGSDGPLAGPVDDGLPDYWSDYRFFTGVPGASSSVAAGLLNPAAWGGRSTGGAFLGFVDSRSGARPYRVNGGLVADGDGEWIGVLSTPGLSFGWRNAPLDSRRGRGERWNEYTIGLSGGDRSQAVGLSYTWSRDGDGRALRTDRFAFGAVRRWRPLSCGVSTVWDEDRGGYFVQADLGVRPIGPRFALLGEVVYEKDQSLDDVRSAYGFEAYPARGVAVGAKRYSTGEYGLSLQIGLAPGFHPEARTLYDDGGDHAATVYVLETGLPTPDLGIGPRGRQFPELELEGELVYQRFRFFDDRTTLLALLQRIDRAAGDPQIGGVVLNLSGFTASPEMAWEIRGQLAALRKAGKTVTVYFDRLGMAGYGLASVADQVWIDPLGDVDLPGIALGRTFMRGALDKLGVGVDELRFFTYKSAAEALSRTSMSEADREQRRALIDDWYETLATDVTAARGIPRESWDRIIDEKGALLASEALAAGLVDSIGSYERAKRAASRVKPRATGDPVSAPLNTIDGDRVWSPLEWGEPATVAVLYGIGECAMETGIRGPVLAREIREAAGDRNVKAIVLRADSPGGDPLPSDLVARELRDAAKKKPVIVSQGQVAGSGGYWISMDADTIVASPYTVTGSIGVIGAWLYDNGLGDKIGFTYDHVKRGEHADIGKGVTFPLIGATLPDRPMTQDERARAEELIRLLYADFVKKVAEGRGMSETAVDAVGQGRVWSGTRGKEKGLVDEIGGLWRSVEIARDAAGIPSSRAIQISEGPGIGMFRIPMPTMGPFRLGWLGRGGDPKGMPVEGQAALLERVAALEDAAGRKLLLTDEEKGFLESVLRSPGAPLLLTEPVVPTWGREP